MLAPPLSRRTVAQSFVLVSALACSDPGSPTAARIERQTTPFYYFDTRRIYLAVDPRRVTVQAVAPSPDTIAPALRELGVATDSVTILYPWPNHWMLWLSPGSTAAQAVRVSERLRADPRFPFVSSAYYHAGTHSSLLLGNQFAVKLRPGVAPLGLQRLNEELGVQWVGIAPFTTDVWMLRFPPRSPYTPLEIVAAYNQHSEAAWASPDFLSEVGPM